MEVRVIGAQTLRKFRSYKWSSCNSVRKIEESFVLLLILLNPRSLVFRVYTIRNSPSCGGQFPRTTSFDRTKRKRVHNPATRLPIHSRGNRFASLNIIAPATRVVYYSRRKSWLRVYRAIDPNESTGILNYRPSDRAWERDKGRAPQPSFSSRVENILRVTLDSRMSLLKVETTVSAPFNRAALLLAIRVESANFANFWLPSSFNRHFGGDLSVHVTFTGQEVLKFE